jgi:hypothetical protein
MATQRLLTLALLVTSIAFVHASGSDQAARQQPNFSGEWLLDLNNSRLHADFAVLERGVVRIEHKESTFTFHREFIVKGHPSEVSFTVTTDGKEHREVAPAGGTTIAVMRWDGDALVLQQRISHPKMGPLSNDVRYELLEDGKTLRSIEDFSGGGRSHHNVWIYRRR